MLLPSHLYSTDDPRPGQLIHIPEGKTVGIDSVKGYRPGNIFTVLDNKGQERMIRQKDGKWEDIRN